MGNLAGILVTGDDFTGDGVCDDGKSKLGLECRSLASLDGTRERKAHISQYCCSRGVATISKAKIHCWSRASPVEEECCKHPFYVMK